MLKPITIKGAEIQCQHAATWPPLWSRLGKTIADIRSRFSLDEYERAKTWEKVCGLQEMSPDKCPTCPFAIVPTDVAVRHVQTVFLHSKDNPVRKREPK